MSASRARFDMRLRSAVARAATLAECVENRSLRTADRAQRDSKCELWQAMLDVGGGGPLQARCKALGPGLEEALGVPNPHWAGELPAWAGIVRDCLASAPSAPPPERYPFDDVLESWVTTGDRLLGARIESRGIQLSASARRGARAVLRTRLAAVALPTLRAEFERAEHAEHGRYASLLQTTRRAGGADFFLERYPVLARLMGQTVYLWIDTLGEMLERVERDRPLLESRLEVSGRLTEVSSTGSDSHQRGRAVLLLQFERGRVAYKPRSVDREAAYYACVTWLNAEFAPPLELTAPRVLSRGAYGYQEAVAHSACADAAAVSRYYRRTGALACLLYLAGVTDVHHENVIACGEHPLLIDVETLRAPGEGPAEPWSVEGTHLLPGWCYDAVHECVWDPSALAAADGAIERSVRWVDMNMDGMRLEVETQSPRRTSLPQDAEGRSVAPGQHLGAMVTGFEETYRRLAQYPASAHNAEDTPLSRLALATGRIVIRPTTVYKQLLWRSLEPDLLEDGVLRSLSFEVLGAPAGGMPPETIAQEIESLERLDVPYFACWPPADLAASDARNDWNRPPATDLRRLDERELTVQLRSLRGAIYASAARRPRAVLPALTSPFNADAVLRALDHLAAELSEHAVWLGDEAHFWSVQEVEATGRFRWGPLGDELGGRAGIALFLAALDAYRETDTHRALVVGALRADARNPQPSSILVRLEVARHTRDPKWIGECAQLGRELAEREPGSAANQARLVAALVGLFRATGVASWLALARTQCGRLIGENASTAPEWVAYARGELASATGSESREQTARRTLAHAKAHPHGAGPLWPVDLELCAGRIDTARQRVATVVSEWQRCGGYRVLEGVPRAFFLPALRDGWTGVGNAMLRALNPTRFPSVAVW